MAPSDILRADTEQPCLLELLYDYLGEWDPAALFLGSPRKFGQCGGGSARRLAVTDAAGPKIPGGRRGYGVVSAATAASYTWSDEEINMRARRQAFGGQGVGPEAQAVRGEQHAEASSNPCHTPPSTPRASSCAPSTVTIAARAHPPPCFTPHGPRPTARLM
jgi:hypothetical protein